MPRIESYENGSLVNTFEVLDAPTSLVLQLQTIMDSVVEVLGTGVSLPLGLPTQVISLSIGLKELARLAPDTVFASEARHAIEALGVLPDSLEELRQQMLNMLIL